MKLKDISTHKKTWFIECQCTHLDHMIVLEYDTRFKEHDICYQIKQKEHLWERLKVAWKYLFNLKGTHYWEDTLIKREDRAKIREWLNAGENNE